jgi:hypothetical protein
MNITNYRHRASECPTCGKTLDVTHSRVEQPSPQAGDFTICLGCGSVLRFDSELLLRAVAEAEIPDDVRIQLEPMRQRWRSTLGR